MKIIKKYYIFSAIYIYSYKNKNSLFYSKYYLSLFIEIQIILKKFKSKIANN